MSIKNPASDLRALLTGQTLAGVLLTSGTNLFAGQMRPDDTSPSDPSVFLLNTGGSAPSAYVNTGGLFFPTVQVMIRGAPDALEAGENLSRAVFNALHWLIPTGYIAVRARESQPFALGFDESNRPMWVINLECSYSTGG